MKRKFLPEDIRNLFFLSYPVLSGDGKKIAYITRKGEEEQGLFPSVLTVLHAESGAVFVEKKDFWYKQPCFLQGSRYLLYLSNQTGEFQIYLENMESGEVCQLTSLRHGVLRYEVNAQETAIVFEAVLWPEEISAGTACTEMSQEEKEIWKTEMEYRPYRATDLTYKMDEWFGMRKGEFSHIGTVSFDAAEMCVCGKTEILEISAEMECIRPTWSHDGKRIAFWGYPNKGARGRQAELFVCKANGTEGIQLTKDMYCSPDQAPVFTADDSAVIGTAYQIYKNGGSLLLPFLGKVSDHSNDISDTSIEFLPVGMKEKEDEIQVCHGVYPAMIGRTEMGEHGALLKLSEDGKWLYFLSALRGKTGLYKAELACPTNTVRLDVAGDMDILAFDLQMLDRNDQGKKEAIVWLGADAMHPAEVFYNEKQLTFSNTWLEECELGHTEEFWTKSRDGKVDLQWFMVHPAGETADGSKPAVLYIKGGPETMYTGSFWHEVQALSGAGMTVILGNQRGSVGFGTEFLAGAICWMNEPMHDLLDMVEDAVSRGFAKHGMIGVTGGSYGGYMTNKLIGRTDTFSAAAAQRCLANPATSYGTGDIGFVSAREIPKNFKMYEYLEDRAKGNIISYIDHIKIPLLILHGTKDYRCSFEQAEQMFVAMRDRNPEIPVRLVAFPGENHNVSRTGKLYNQIRHLKEIVDWFVKYLGEDGEHYE